MYPNMYRIRQTFEGPVITDIPVMVRAELVRAEVASVIKPGQSVALTAGSRGVANIATVIKAVAEYLQTIGAKPFVIPAMGSHGGGTADGQLDVLRHYGITEDSMGIPLRASMEVEIRPTEWTSTTWPGTLASPRRRLHCSRWHHRPRGCLTRRGSR